MSTTDIDKKIESILFYSNEPLSKEDMAKILDVDLVTADSGLKVLLKNLENRGISLLEHDGLFSLSTSKDSSDIIEKMIKEELNKDLSQASLETLSIVLYKSPVTKKEIEYIRGVNSSFSIRNLLIRGLIEREQSSLDERIYLYKPSRDLFLHLGITKIEEMPGFKEIEKDLLENLKNENVEMSVDKENQF